MTISGFWGALLFAILATVFAVPYFILFGPSVGVSSAFRAYLLVGAVVFSGLDLPSGQNRVTGWALVGFLGLLLAETQGTEVSLVLGAGGLMGAFRLLYSPGGRTSLVAQAVIEVSVIIVLYFLFRWSVSMSLQVSSIFLIGSVFFCQAILVFASQVVNQRDPKRFERAYRIAIRRLNRHGF